jgi:hypothetical protein
MSCYYGPLETWKVVYYPANTSHIGMCTALVEADSHQMAMQAFREQYSGQYRNIQSCKKLLG